MRSGRVSRISAIRIYRVDLPLRLGLRHASASATVLQEVLLGVEASSGARGIAEIRGNGDYATKADAKTVIDETQQSVVDALLGCELAEASSRIAALAVEPLTKALADSAVHDVRAREVDRPIWQLLGGRPQESIATHAQIGFCAAEEAAERARAAARDGFQRVKVRLGRTCTEADIAVVRAVRHAVGDGVAIAVDANGSWDAETAANVLCALEPMEIAWAEQPTAADDDEALRAARQATRIPVIGDDAIRRTDDIGRLSRLGAVDGVHLKLEKAGTVASLVNFAERAREAGLKVFLGQMDQGRLGSSFTTHLAASIEAEAYELWGFQDVMSDVAVGLEIRRGTMPVPTGPGNGVTVDTGRLHLIGDFQ
jgi:L-Ala-D/L-Glu epimerase